MNGNEDYPEQDRRHGIADEPGEVGTNPWEQPGGLSRPAAFWETWKASVLRPGNFFPTVDPRGSLGQAVAFLVIVVVLGSIFSAVWDLLLPFGDSAADARMGPLAIFFMTIILAPIAGLVSLVIGGAVFHVILLIVGGADNGFTATLRALSYASGPAVFSIVPLIGQFIGMVWGVVLAIIALRDLHRTRTWKAAVAVLLPVAVLLVLLVIVIVLGAAAALLAGS